RLATRLSGSARCRPRSRAPATGRTPSSRRRTPHPGRPRNRLCRSPLVGPPTRWSSWRWRWSIGTARRSRRAGRSHHTSWRCCGAWPARACPARNSGGHASTGSTSTPPSRPPPGHRPGRRRQRPPISRCAPPTRVGHGCSRPRHGSGSPPPGRRVRPYGWPELAPRAGPRGAPPVPRLRSARADSALPAAGGRPGLLFAALESLLTLLATPLGAVGRSVLVDEFCLARLRRTGELHLGRGEIVAGARRLQDRVGAGEGRGLRGGGGRHGALLPRGLDLDVEQERDRLLAHAVHHRGEHVVPLALVL